MLRMQWCRIHVPESGLRYETGVKAPYLKTECFISELVSEGNTQSRSVVVNHAGLWSRRLWFESGRDYLIPIFRK